LGFSIVTHTNLDREKEKKKTKRNESKPNKNKMREHPIFGNRTILFEKHHFDKKYRYVHVFNHAIRRTIKLATDAQVCKSNISVSLKLQQ
jgi:hypothetical protein